MITDLSSSEIHIYFAFTDEINDADLLIEYQDLLTQKEKDQWQRFYFARHRRQYLITRALIRTTLSRYIDIDPQDWRFSLNKHGRPEISREHGDLNIRFNLSHTDGLVMCGVTLENEIGVDVENKQRKNELLKIADRYFSVLEVSELNQVPGNAQKHRFFEYWTLKESYIKARGMGLSLPLDQFSFHLNHGQPVEISFDPKLKDEPKHWTFWRLIPTEHHIAALAIKSLATTTFKVQVNKIVPLRSNTKLNLSLY